MEKINKTLRKIFIAFIGFYQKAISPLFPAKCRYYPSCSQYAKEAITNHSLLKGCWLSLKRILKCNPFSKGGFDPVPEPHESIKKEK